MSAVRGDNWIDLALNGLLMSTANALLRSVVSMARMILAIQIVALLLMVSLPHSSFAGEKITLATLNWEPFFGESLQGEGVFSSIVRTAFHRAGYELEVQFTPWKRALETAKNGGFSGLLGAYHNREREEYFFYTDPIMQSEEVFVEKRGSDISFAELDELKQYSIGTIRGFSFSPELIRQGFQIEEASTDLPNIRKLLAGRVNLIIIEKHRFRYLLNQYDEFGSLKNAFHILTPSFHVYDLYCTISKLRSEGEKVISDFNEALQGMKEDGTYNRILSEFRNDLDIGLSDNQ